MRRNSFLEFSCKFLGYLSQCPVSQNQDPNAKTIRSARRKNIFRCPAVPRKSWSFAPSFAPVPGGIRENEGMSLTEHVCTLDRMQVFKNIHICSRHCAHCANTASRFRNKHNPQSLRVQTNPNVSFQPASAPRRNVRSENFRAFSSGVSAGRVSSPSPVLMTPALSASVCKWARAPTPSYQTQRWHAAHFLVRELEHTLRIPHATLTGEWNIHNGYHALLPCAAALQR